MTLDEIQVFLKLQPKLQITHDEMSILSKKSPNDAVNTFKLKFLNDMLRQANAILGEDYKPFDDFEEFSEDNLPFNSDVVFILAPYLRSLEKLRCDNIKKSDYDINWYWVAEGKTTELRTTRPTIQ
jgi:hypothetical protein